MSGDDLSEAKDKTLQLVVVVLFASQPGCQPVSWYVSHWPASRPGSSSRWLSGDLSEAKDRPDKGSHGYADSDTCRACSLQ
jgi:hypothetical protein